MNKLEQTLIEIIQEQQLKLGYMEETIRLYFPITSIEYLLDLDGEPDKNLINETLTKERKSIEGNFGPIRFKSETNRYALIIPPKGSTYVYESIPKNVFLEGLIQLFNSHEVDIEKVKSLFNQFDPNYICEKSDDPEFNYIISFKNKDIDRYFYLLKLEEGHSSYHRYNEHDMQGIL